MLIPVKWLLRCTNIGTALGNQVVRSPAYLHTSAVALKVCFTERGVGVKSSHFLGGHPGISLGNGCKSLAVAQNRINCRMCSVP
jgi:hypothetical protein